MVDRRLREGARGHGCEGARDRGREGARARGSAGALRARAPRRATRRRISIPWTVKSICTASARSSPPPSLRARYASGCVGKSTALYRVPIPATTIPPLSSLLQSPLHLLHFTLEICSPLCFFVCPSASGNEMYHSTLLSTHIPKCDCKYKKSYVHKNHANVKFGLRVLK